MKLILLLLSSSLLLISYQDLGTFGKQYPIKEENIKRVLKKALLEKKDSVQEMAKKAFNSGLTYSKALPFSDNDSTEKKKLSLSVPGGPMQGQKIESSNIPYQIKDSLCVVSFDGYNILDELIMEFGNECRYVFLNVDIREISNKEKYEGINKFIGNDTLFNILDINSTPTKFTLNGDTIEIQTLDYERIKAQAKERLLSNGN